MKKEFVPVSAAATANFTPADFRRAPKNNSLVYISTGMTGKMEGIPAISTSVLSNPVCAARSRISGSICQKCFAQNTVSNYGALRDHVTDNYMVLNSRLLSADELPAVYSDICRLEAFGDLASVIQARNYIRIAKKNPWCTFAIWTKNPAYLDKAIQAEGKPENLICILSSNFINRVDSAARWNWVDHVFTVYSPDYIDSNDISINCGGRKCRECMRCYTVGNPEFHVFEKLK